MHFFKALKKIAAPALAVVLATYVLKTPGGVRFPAFENAELSDVYLNAEKAAEEIIPDKIQNFISYLTELIKGNFSNGG